MSAVAASRRVVLALGAAGALLAVRPGTAMAAAGRRWVGRYRVAEGPDVAGELVLAADGRFAYWLAAGALDETAQGRWREDGDGVLLTTEPKPRPPVFAPAAGGDEAANGPLRVTVTSPDGRGIAGVDFRIGFAVGEPFADYTQEDGWTEPDGSLPDPLWIELAEPIHGIASPRFPVAAGQRLLAFVLTPNDLGVVDFDAAPMRRDGESIALTHPRGGQVRLRRVEAGE